MVVISLFNFLSLKTLLPIKDIFLILALSPNSISKFIITRLLSRVSKEVFIIGL